MTENKHAMMIEKIDHKGVLVGECSLLGERRSDDVVPAHPNGIPVSRDRWLVVYATRGFRGVDDDRSIIYQIRRGAPDGEVIREGLLSRSVDDWDPFGEGARYFKQHGHPVAFGVPKGARIAGRPVPHANLFVAKWRVIGLNIQGGLVSGDGVHLNRVERTQGVEWVQFRLNDREDDIEIVQPVRPLRQKGYESGEAFCSAADAGHMNQSFVQAVPFNRDATEWADCNHFRNGGVAALKYRYNAALGLYEWVETGPFLRDAHWSLSEASLARYRDSWVIAARTGHPAGRIAWARTDDPFASVLEPVYPEDLSTNAPLTAYACPDGVLRLFTGNPKISPYCNGRDPLYCWDINPDARFRAENCLVVFDSVASGLLRAESVPRVDMCKLLPHGGGRTQTLAFRVRVKKINQPYAGLPAITAEEKARCAIHHATITYAEEWPGCWDFGSLPSPR